MHRTIVTALLSLKSFTHNNANYSSPSSRMPFERGYYYPHKYYRFGLLFPVTMRRWQGKGRTSVLYVAPLFVFLFLFFQLPTEMTGEGEPQDTWLSHLCQRQRPHLKRVREKEHLTVTWKPVGEGSIFFTQTSCATDFSSREVRTVEGRGIRGEGGGERWFYKGISIGIRVYLREVVRRVSTTMVLKKREKYIYL